MKNITKEQIDEVVNEATKEATKNIQELLLNNIETWETSYANSESTKQYSIYVATMSTSIQVSMDIIKKSLYELLRED